jgi:hypothetical protein
VIPEGARQHPAMQRATPGVNAAVVGLPRAAFYQPVWTSAIRPAQDFAPGGARFAAAVLESASVGGRDLLCGGRGAGLGLMPRGRVQSEDVANLPRRRREAPTFDRAAGSSTSSTNSRTFERNSASSASPALVVR